MRGLGAVRDIQFVIPDKCCALSGMTVQVWREVYPVSADPCENRGLWHDRASEKIGNFRPWTPAFAGVDGELDKGVFWDLRAEFPHTAHPGERRDLVQQVRKQRERFRVKPGMSVQG